MLSREQLKRVITTTAGVVLILDFFHIYRYLDSYYETDRLSEEEEEDSQKLKEDKEILKCYEGNCNEKEIISKEQFDSSVESILKELEEADCNTGLYPLDHPGLKVMRESIVFAGGGRATFMQLTHPFIAAGIQQHSMLESGVSRRFYNTFKYMFGMTFGTRKEMADAARAVRGLHSKVSGKIGEDVGIFNKDSNFSAAQESAMKFVGASLLETAVFEYEMHVNYLKEEDKDEMVRANIKLLMLFGVRPSSTDPHTWKEFRRHMSALWRSKLLQPSEAALDTTEFLFLPPSPQYKPMLDLIRWSTICTLPPRLAKQFSHRVPNVFDKVLFSLFHAIIRFVYRLTPGSWRFLTAYWKMVERTHPETVPAFSKAIQKCSASFTNMFLAQAMPPRDPEKARELVKQKRMKERFERMENSTY